MARREVGDGVADQQRDRERDRDERDRAQEERQELLAVEDVVEHRRDVTDVPMERVPERHGLRERVLVPERDGDNRVERDKEEHRQPRDSRKREQPPLEACPHDQPALNFDQASSQSRSPSMLSCSNSWFAANWSGRRTASVNVLGMRPCLISAVASIAFCGGVYPTKLMKLL